LIYKKITSNESKYWIHKFDKKLLRQLNSKKILGAKNKRSKILNNFEPNDKIILFTTLDLDKQKKISFIAYTMVEDTFKDNETLYNHYNSPKKLGLKGIKYFTDPVVARDIASELSFIKNKEKSASDLNAEYKEISEEDFKKIIKKTSLTKEYPAYFEKVSYIMDDFLLNAIKGLYSVIKITEKRNQIEIKTFLKLLKKFLQEYNISKTYDEVEDFYAKNVWKLSLKHIHSRDPDKFVTLYNRFGEKSNFSYINLE
jgi:predicted RNA-binding protein